MNQNPLILIASLVLLTHQARTQSVSSSYGWPNTPCAGVINCNNGCSACNMAVNNGAGLLGAGSSWLGVDLCPHPNGGSDNALHVSGWGAFTSIAHQGLLSWLVTTPLHIDSIVIRHRGTADGPSRLRVTFTPSADMPLVETADEAIPTAWTRTVLTDLGCIAPAPGMSYTQLTLGLQGYLGGAGDWIVDEVTVVATPCAAGATSIEAWSEDRSGQVATQRIDLLGRQLGHTSGPGVQHGSPRVVVVTP